MTILDAEQQIDVTCEKLIRHRDTIVSIFDTFAAQKRREALARLESENDVAWKMPCDGEVQFGEGS